MRATFLISCLVSTASIALAAPAHAQDAATPVTDQSQAEAASNAGDIVVTATRRSEALSDVPIAISAVSGETLQNTGATDVRALNQVAPSLLVSGATSEVNFTARIRGIGTVGENAGLESSVGLFIDGVYRSRTGVGLSELGDIERVEVLRGPQGTLFGRNSTAGLINIVTKGPELGRFMAKGALTYGNYDFWRVDGAVNAPIGQDAAFRLDGVWQQRDGYIKALTPGEPDMNDRDRWLLRGQFAYEPTDALSVRLIGDYSKRDENCCAGVLLGPVRGLTRQPDGSVAYGPNSLFGLVQALGANYPTLSGDQRFVFGTPTSPGVRYTSDSEDWGVSGEVNYDFGGATLTSITAYRDYKNKQGQDGDFSALDILDRQNLDRRFRLFSQELRLQGEALDGRLDWLVGAYYSTEKLDVVDDIRYGRDYTRFANCLAAASLAGAGVGAVNPALPTCTTAPAAAFPGFNAIAAALGASPLNGTGANGNAFRQDAENYAFFTHNTLDIVEDVLKLTVGVRYTHEAKDLSGDTRANNTLCPAIVNSPLQSFASLACVINGAAIDIPKGSPGSKFRDGEWTGTAVLSFKPIDSLLIYGSASKGYKAGGFNLDFSALDRACSTTAGSAAQNAACVGLRALPANTQGNGRPEVSDLAFQSEKVWAYEVGAKWNGPGVDINLAAFYQEYTDYQLNTYNGVNFEVTNIQACKDDLGGTDRDNSATSGRCAPDRLRPGVVSKGFELETFLRPHRDVSVNMALTYTDSYYRRNLVGTGGRPLSPVLFQLPGDRVSNSSQYSATAGVSWTPDIGNSGMSALFYLDTRLQSDTNTGSDLDPEKVQDGFVVVNGRVGIYGEGKRWGLEFWAQNIFNERYFQIGADMPLQGSGSLGTVTAPVAAGFPATANQLFVGFPGEPRMYGVTLRGSF
jgi:outer membrane receptor protein involved in Fe transport